MTFRCVMKSDRRRPRPGGTAAACALLGWLSLCGPAGADQDYTAWQAMTVLTANKLQAAAAHCGFTVNDQKLGVLLASADLTVDAVRIRPRSPALSQEIDAYAAGFQSDRDGACASAWDAFGADADPGVRDLLTR